MSGHYVIKGTIKVKADDPTFRSCLATLRGTRRADVESLSVRVVKDDTVDIYIVAGEIGSHEASAWDRDVTAFANRFSTQAAVIYSYIGDEETEIYVGPTESARLTIEIECVDAEIARLLKRKSKLEKRAAALQAETKTESAT